MILDENIITLRQVIERVGEQNLDRDWERSMIRY